MDKLVVTAASRVSDADRRSATMGSRFGRLDQLSQLAIVAVESLGLNFDTLPSERIGICLAARAGSLSTDLEYWEGRNEVGGPSPTLFTYTLPSSAIGEIAIRYRITGPNLCLIDGCETLLSEAADLIFRGEADACLCLSCNVISQAAAETIQEPPTATACALFLTTGYGGLHEIDRDIESLCALLSTR